MIIKNAFELRDISDKECKKLIASLYAIACLSSSDEGFNWVFSQTFEELKISIDFYSAFIKLAEDHPNYVNKFLFKFFKYLFFKFKNIPGTAFYCIKLIIKTTLGRILIENINLNVSGLRIKTKEDVCHILEFKNLNREKTEFSLKHDESKSEIYSNKTSKEFVFNNLNDIERNSRIRDINGEDFLI